VPDGPVTGKVRPGHADVRGRSVPLPFGKSAGKGTRPAPDDLEQDARRGR
jgi:hypothetical protein